MIKDKKKKEKQKHKPRIDRENKENKKWNSLKIKYANYYYYDIYIYIKKRYENYSITLIWLEINIRTFKRSLECVCVRKKSTSKKIKWFLKTQENNKTNAEQKKREEKKLFI